MQLGRSRSGERIVPGVASVWVVWLVWVVWGAETLKPLVSITSSMRVHAGRSKNLVEGSSHDLAKLAQLRTIWSGAL